MVRRQKSRKPDRPPWCQHYDIWRRAYDEADALMAQNSDRAEDWSPEDIARLHELTETYGAAAIQMWDEAPESENWESAHIKCG